MTDIDNDIRAGCKVCGDEKILMEPDDSNEQPCYACQPVGTMLEQARKPYSAEPLAPLTRRSIMEEWEAEYKTSGVGWPD